MSQTPFSIVYVVSGAGSDPFTEQCLVSIDSLRRVMPDAPVTVFMDRPTFDGLGDLIAPFERLRTTLDVVDLPEDWSGLKRSGFLKTSLFDRMAGDFLFLDTDTVVCDDLSPISAYKGNLLALPDRNCRFQDNPTRAHMQESATKLGGRPAWGGVQFNNGVLFVRHTEEAGRFFSAWHQLWLDGLERGVLGDQPAMNEVNCRFSGAITQIPAVWNCQLDQCGQWLPALGGAKVLHYLGDHSDETALYALNLPDTLAYGATGPSPATAAVLEDPKAAVQAPQLILMKEQDARATRSPLFSQIKRLSYVIHGK